MPGDTKHNKRLSGHYKGKVVSVNMGITKKIMSDCGLSRAAKCMSL